MKFKEIACAKVNIFLDVLSKREDGFHEIKSIMHSVSLFDTLSIDFQKALETKISLKISGEYDLPTDRTNLVYKAAELFFERTGVKAEVNINLDKQIPVAAGLGGGSSDAAATLRALNRAVVTPLSEDELLKLAQRLGSDVPYCLVGGTAIVEGRGERLKKIGNDFNRCFVIAIADEAISAKEAYSLLDSLYNNFTVPRCCEDRLKESLFFISTNAIGGEAYNVFEDAILPRYKGAEELRKKMRRLGAVMTLLCGSGPAVFGIFDDQDSAEYARFKLAKNGYKAYSVTSFYMEG